MPRPPTTQIQFLFAAILVSLFAGAAFYQLGNRPLQDWDEAIYAQVAREAMQSGNQFDLTWVGNPASHRMFFDKPPLMIWFTEISYAVFGINEFAARLGTTIFAVLTLPLTFLFAQKLSRSFSAALLAIAAFFTAFQYEDYSRLLQLDIPVGFFVTLALFAFWLARENDKFHYLFWLALAFGVMIKSVIGLLPLPIMFVFSLMTKDFQFLRRKTFWLGAVLFLALILPWHIVESVRHGRDFWRYYVMLHVLKRYSTTLDANGGSFWFYLGVFWQQPVFFCALAGSLAYLLAASVRSPPHLFVMVAFLFIFLFFSAAATKLPPYILVIYPLAATMIGMALADLSAALEKCQKHSGAALATFAVLFFLFTGLANERRILPEEKNPQLVSDKAVGEFLKTNGLDEPAFYFSAGRLKPSIIFYADRHIGDFGNYRHSRPAGDFILISEVPPPNFSNSVVLFSVETEKVYQIQ